MDQEAVPAKVNESRLQIEAKKPSQDTQTPSKVFVWIDGAWSGEPVSCKPPFAGACRLKNHAIETPRVSRWETFDHHCKQDSDIDENSETCIVVDNKAARDVKDTAEKVTPVTAEVLDVTENLNNEFERAKESEEQFLGVRDVPEQLSRSLVMREHLQKKLF